MNKTFYNVKTKHYGKWDDEHSWLGLTANEMRRVTKMLTHKRVMKIEKCEVVEQKIVGIK